MWCFILWHFFGVYFLMCWFRKQLWVSSVFPALNECLNAFSFYAARFSCDANQKKNSRRNSKFRMQIDACSKSIGPFILFLSIQHHNGTIKFALSFNWHKVARIYRFSVARCGCGCAFVSHHWIFYFIRLLYTHRQAHRFVYFGRRILW